MTDATAEIARLEDEAERALDAATAEAFANRTLIDPRSRLLTCAASRTLMARARELRAELTEEEPAAATGGAISPDLAAAVQAATARDRAAPMNAEIERAAQAAASRANAATATAGTAASLSTEQEIDRVAAEILGCSVDQLAPRAPSAAPAVTTAINPSSAREADALAAQIVAHSNRAQGREPIGASAAEIEAENLAAGIAACLPPARRNAAP